MATEHSDNASHGDTIAAWTAVIIIIIGFSGLVLFYFLEDMTLTYVSAGVILVGAVTGPILSALGFGKKR
jgi:Na+/proline symporter